MKYIGTEEIPINKIHSNVNQPRETFDKEKIKELATSIKGKGLMHPIIIRSFNDGYKIIAGERRYKAFQMLDMKEIPSRIVESDDHEAEIISIIENYQREDLTDEEQQKCIYTAWTNGNKGDNSLFGNNIANMHDCTGIPLSTLTHLIEAGKEKANSKSEIILKSSAEDLNNTRSVEKISPKLREEILQSKHDGKINSTNLRSVVKDVNAAVKEGTSKKDVEKIVNKVIKDTPQNEKIKSENVKNLFDAVKQLPSDLKDKVLNGKIDIEEANVVSLFPTEEQRNQVIKERKILKDESNRKIEKHIETRQKQAVSIKNGKSPEDFTEFDFEKMKKERLKSPEYINDRIISSYGDYVMKFCFSADAIKRMSPEGAKIAIGYVRKVYELCHKILVDHGEIKVIENNISPSIDINLINTENIKET